MKDSISVVSDLSDCRKEPEKVQALSEWDSNYLLGSLALR